MEKFLIMATSLGDGKKEVVGDYTLSEVEKLVDSEFRSDKLVVIQVLTEYEAYMVCAMRWDGEWL